MYKYIISIILLFVNYYGFDSYLVIRFLPIIFFIYIIIEEVIFKRPNVQFFNKEFSLLHILALLLIINILASTKPDMSIQIKMFRIGLFILFLFTFFTSIFKKIYKEDLFTIFIKYVYIPVVLFFGVNLFLFIIGLKNSGQDIGDAVLLSYFGLAVKRSEFFLSPGINAYGSSLGVFLNLSLIGFGIIKKKRSLFLIGILISLISLFLTDSRGPIVFSILIYCIIKFIYIKSKTPKFLWLIPLIGFIGPILLLSILAFLATTDYGSALSRSSEDLSTGNARSIIWTFAASDFLTFKPQNHIFGYGEFGQHAAGVSQQWAYVFSDDENAEYMHPHNMFLSIALDFGYFGLLIFTIFQFTIIKIITKNWNSERNICYILLANILYFNLIGITETAFGFYYQNIIYIFFMINTFAFIMKFFNKKNKNFLSNDRYLKIHSISYPTSSRTQAEGNPIYTSMVQFKPREG